MKIIRLRAAAIIAFVLCVAITGVAVKAESPPRACKTTTLYPPLPKRCDQPPCINKVTPATLAAATDFQVTFAGIICLGGGAEGNPPSLTRQAMMIHGNFFTKRHTPMIGVHGADAASLRDASGHSVECDHTYCWTSVHGLRLRIVGDSDKPPTGDAVDEDDSFCDLVPRLRSLVAYVPPMKYDLCADDGNSLPKSPVAGCFDIAGGTLMAYPFKRFQQGRFLFANGQVSDPLQFADVVIWYGTTTGAARLQIKSPESGVWRTVLTKIPDVPLLVAVANLGHAHHVTTHFALNEKIYDHLTGNLPKIIADNVPACDPQKVYCYTGITSFIDVAGCSDTRP